MTVPYTYLLKHIPTGMVYYGCRFAEGCSPEEFWKTYKTSSKHVHQLIEQTGLDSFSYEIRKTFSDKNHCRNWETRVLQRMNVVKNKLFLNRTDNISISPEDASKGRKGKTVVNSTETKEKMRLAKIGKKLSEETKKKMSDIRKAKTGDKNGMFGKKMSEETKMKMRAAKLGKTRAPRNKNGE